MRTTARVPACLQTYPRRGKVPAPARSLRPSSRRAPEPPRASARRGAGRGGKGKRGGKRSRAGAQPLLLLGQAAAEPRGRREGRAGSLRQWRRPRPEGKRNNHRRCAWPQPWGRATAGSGEGRGAERGGTEARAPLGGDRHHLPVGEFTRGLSGVVVWRCVPLLSPTFFFWGVVSILRETASPSCSSALSPVRSVPTKDTERRFLLHEPAPGHLFLRIHPLSIFFLPVVQCILVLIKAHLLAN